MSTFSATIAATADDCFTWWHLGTFGDTVAGVFLGDGGGYGNNVYHRYPSATISNGATVSAASESMYAVNAVVGTPALHLGCSDEDNAANPTTYAGAEGRSYTTSKTSWDASNFVAANTYYDTADFSASAQELFARGGWSSGNAILVIHRNNSSASGNYLYAGEYNRTPSKPSTINITYTASGGGGTAIHLSTLGVG